MDINKFFTAMPRYAKSRPPPRSPAEKGWVTHRSVLPSPTFVSRSTPFRHSLHGLVWLPSQMNRMACDRDICVKEYSNLFQILAALNVRSSTYRERTRSGGLISWSVQQAKWKLGMTSSNSASGQTERGVELVIS